MNTSRRAALFPLAAIVAAILAVFFAIASVEAAADPQSDTATTVAVHQDSSDNGGVDVVPVAVWTAVGVAVGSVIFGTLYLLKRRVGGFPRNPSWVAPISIMESREFPDEGDFGDQEPSGQAHAEH